jgi:hypothetical protein
MADEFSINTTTAGDQDQPGVAGLQGTQFITVWRDTGTQDIKGRLFGVDGVASSGEFNISFPQPPGTKRQLPAIVELANGFAVAWIEQLPGARPQLKLRVFDADSLSGPETQLSSAEVEPLIRPAMTRLLDGGFVVVWADVRQNERLRAQRFTSDGTKSGPEFRANTVAGLHRVPMVAGLTNGNFVIGWRARLPGPLLVHLQMFGATGPIGTEQTTSLDITEAAMAPLDTGRFAVAHIRSALDGETGFDTTIAQASLFEADGTSVTRIPATSGQNIQSSWPTLAPLSGGRFLLAWTQFNTANTAAGTNVHARIFESRGPIGQAVQVNTLRGGNRFRLAAAITSGPAGDTAFLAWADDGNAGPDTSERAVQGRVLPIPAAGF